MKNYLSSSKLALFAFFLVCGLSTKAQLHVAMTGDVGIGTTSPFAKLHVMKDSDNVYITGYFEDAVTSNYKVGIYGYHYMPKDGTTYGILNYAFSNYTSSPGVNSTNGIYNYTSGARGYAQGIYNSTNQSYDAMGYGYGIYNDLYTGTSDYAYGIYNNVYTPSGNVARRWGIYNYVYPASGSTIGIYSSTSGATNHAGYFDGNVHINGSLTVISDERKKQNISDLDGAVDIVRRLNGHVYTFIDDPNMNLPEGQQYGFLAQEIEQVLPGVVKTIENPLHPTATPTQKTPNKGDKVEIEVPAAVGTETVKSVNYLAVIPILVEAIKEQQMVIEKQQQQIQALEQKVGK